MLDELAPESVFSEIMMMDPPATAVLMVEGSDEDTIFAEHVKDGVLLKVCGGKSNALRAAKIAVQNGFKNVFALIDLDLDELCFPGLTYPYGVVTTSCYDLVTEILLANSDFLRRILWAQSSAVVKEVEQMETDVTGYVFNITNILAGVRLANSVHKYGLRLKDFNFTKAFKQATARPNLDNVLSSLEDRHPEFNFTEALSNFQEALSCINDERRFSGGHDIVGASAALLNHYGAKNVEKKAIHTAILALANDGRLLASLDCVIKLNMFAEQMIGVTLIV